MIVAELLMCPPTEATITELLHEVIDPELGINIIDLGLVREVAVGPGGVVRIATTLTTPACPLGPYITGQIEELVGQVVGSSAGAPAPRCSRVIRRACTTPTASASSRATATAAVIPRVVSHAWSRSSRDGL